jgi:hypothetical protein
MLRKSPYSLPPAEYGGARKRLFIGLTAGSCLLVGFVFFLGWLVPYLGLSAIHPALPHISTALCFLFLSLLAWLCLGLVFHMYTGLSLPGIARIRSVTIRLMLPLMVLLGRALGISREQVRLSFIKTNNELVLASHVRCAPEDLLVLVPHCLQQSACPHRLATDLERCKRCGECPIHSLLSLRERYGFKLCVATGGTVARRVVADERPRLIIAVACDRDLTSGIQDCYPIPVFGLLNERPLGPCRDTLVSVAGLEKFVRHFTRQQPDPA